MEKDEEVLGIKKQIKVMDEHIELLAKRIFIHEKKLEILKDVYENEIINVTEIDKEVEEKLYG